jgi:hypothetical protein
MFKNAWKLICKGEVKLARDWQARLATESHKSEHNARRLFLEDFSSGGGRISLGRTSNLSGDWDWVGIQLQRLLQSHMLTTGATGMGKTLLIAAVLYQLLRRGITIILLDMKSELSEIVLNIVVPALAVQGIDVGPIRVVRTFDNEHVPLLRLTEPEPGVSREIQALNLASSLAEAVGLDLQVRMHRMFLRTSSLAIEKNQPLTVIAEWVSNPAKFVRDARSSNDPQVRNYAQHDFLRENRASLDALRARLDEMFHLREIRLALSAPRCLSFPETLESGLTIFDFGSPPAGAESASRFIGGPILGRVTRSILSRPVVPTTKQAVIVLEEFQELLGRHQIEQFKRLLSLSRFKRATLWFSNQQPAQIADVDPMLLRILRTNVGMEMIFRASTEDAATLSKGLSIRRPDESLSAARARFTEDIASLPQREFYLWAKDRSYGPQRVRSPRIDLEELAAEAKKLPPDRRAQIQRGTVSVPVSRVRELSPEYTEEKTLKPRKRTPGLG